MYEQEATVVFLATECKQWLRFWKAADELLTVVAVLVSLTMGCVLDANAASEITEERFSSDVIEASNEDLVIVEMWAAWCGSCRRLGPRLEQLVDSFDSGPRHLRLDVDTYPSVAGQLGVRMVPTVLAFRKGQIIGSFEGAISDHKIQDFLESLR